MRAYSMDLRERILRDSDAGMKASAVAVKYHVSASWVRRLKQRRRETGEWLHASRGTGGGRCSPPAAHARGADPGATGPHPRRTAGALATSASLTTIWRAVNQLGFTLKKTMRASEHDRPDIAAARAQWAATAPTLDPTHLVFLDESGVATNLLRLYGRGLRGQRVADHAPQGRWESSTFIAALRVTGLTAPGVLDGPMDGPVSSPTSNRSSCRPYRPGDIVIADNLATHKVEGCKPPLQPPARRCGSCRPTARLQPHRALLRQTQSDCP